MGTDGLAPPSNALEAFRIATTPSTQKFLADLRRVSTIHVAREQSAPHFWRSARYSLVESR